MYERYSDLTVTHLTQEMHERTCGYWYTVQNRWTPHTAFETRAGLDLWLSERGLSIVGDIENELWCKIAGEYQRVGWLITPEEFEAIEGLRTEVMSNGDWTLGIINEENGIPTVHYLNCNVRNRPIFDYQATNRKRR